MKEDEVKEKFSTPGAKHLNFKEHMLKSLIDKKRAKWQEYQQEKRKLYGTQSSDEEEFGKQIIFLGNYFISWFQSWLNQKPHPLQIQVQTID